MVAEEKDEMWPYNVNSRRVLYSYTFKILLGSCFKQDRERNRTQGAGLA
jgi:hypothetical protein